MTTYRHLRSLPVKERVEAFDKLDTNSKVELFFVAMSRHPRDAGLDLAFAMQGPCFARRLRDELDKQRDGMRRGGIPEVLGFLSVVRTMKLRGLIAGDQIRDLQLDSVCALAQESEFCPEMVQRLLRGVPESPAMPLRNDCELQAK